MRLNRRDFLLLSSAFSAPFVFSGRASALVRNFAANEKVRVGIVGCGRIATSFEIPNLIKNADVAEIVAICDLDARRLRHGKNTIEAEYAKIGAKTVVDACSDYKVLCARKDIDAVMVCLPDFWHALVAVTVICSGKALWLQKPFTQTIGEGRILANLAKKYNTVVQVGSQQRSWGQFDAVCRAVQEGRLGRIVRVEVGIGRDRAGGCRTAQPVPEGFDYQTWLGPTDGDVPYNETRCHAQDVAKIGSRPGWIQLAPYGWGMITNWGAHHIDIAQWGLGRQFSGPDSVEGTCSWMDQSGDKLWNVHTSYDLHYMYGSTEMHVHDRYQNGIKFVGENGDWLFCTRGKGKVTASDPDAPVDPKRLPAMAASKSSLLPNLVLPANNRVVVCSHVRNWLEAVRASDPSRTVTTAEGGHRSTSSCSLGQMCMALGRGRKDGFKLSWDPKAETTGLAEADSLMKPFSRDKFDLRVNLAEFGLDYGKVATDEWSA